MFGFLRTLCALARIPLLTYAGLLAVQGIHHGAAAASGVFEVDLIFPRNDTYAPIALMPLTFAVQNPGLASLLVASISYDVSQLDNYSSPAEVSDEFDLSQLNSSIGNTYFASRYFGITYGIESRWVLKWELSIGNCSNSTNIGWQGSVQNNFIIFSTNNSAPAPNLVSATSANTCAKSEGLTFNVTGTQSGFAHPEEGFSQSSCAVLASGPSPTANPCATWNGLYIKRGLEID